MTCLCATFLTRKISRCLSMCTTLSRHALCFDWFSHHTLALMSKPRSRWGVSQKICAVCARVINNRQKRFQPRAHWPRCTFTLSVSRFHTPSSCVDQINFSRLDFSLCASLFSSGLTFHSEKKLRSGESMKFLTADKKFYFHSLF